MPDNTSRPNADRSGSADSPKATASRCRTHRLAERGC